MSKKSASRLSIELPEELSSALEREAERLEISLNSLVEGLIKKFLQKQAAALEKAQAAERRSTQREPLAQSAVLHFEADNGLYGLYRSGDMKNIALDGALLECETNISDRDLFRIGSEFELIFQPGEGLHPLHVWCRVRRATQAKGRMRLGVAFARLDAESRKTLTAYLNSKEN